jgi:hypothetical protein
MARDGGRPCGCDPRANHVCESHRAHVDRSETEIEGAYRLEGGVTVQELIVVVTGPDIDGEFGILGVGGEWTILPRFVAEDLIEELQRRLRERA